MGVKKRAKGVSKVEVELGSHVFDDKKAADRTTEFLGRMFAGQLVIVKCRRRRRRRCSFRRPASELRIELRQYRTREGGVTAPFAAAKYSAARFMARSKEKDKKY